MRFRPITQVFLALSCVSMPEEVSVLVDMDKESTVVVMKKEGQDNDITIMFNNKFIEQSYASRLSNLIYTAMKDWKSMDLPKPEKRGKLDEVQNLKRIVGRKVV